MECPSGNGWKVAFKEGWAACLEIDLVGQDLGKGLPFADEGG